MAKDKNKKYKFVELVEQDIKESNDKNGESLIEALKRNLPHSVQFLNILNIKLQKRYATENIKNLQVLSLEEVNSEDSDTTVGIKRPERWKDNSQTIFLVLFVHTNYKFTENYSNLSLVFCNKEDPTPDMTSEFVKLFDWSKPQDIGAVNAKFAIYLENVITLQKGTLEKYPDWVMYMPEDYWSNLIVTPDKIKENSTSEIKVHKLTQAEADIVNDHWKFKDETTLIQIQDSIENFVSAGVWVNEELVCWIISLVIGTLNALHTKETERRKGYAEMTLREAASQAIEFGMYPICEVERDNLVSKKLLEKVGFKVAYDACWMNYKPKI